MKKVSKGKTQLEQKQIDDRFLFMLEEAIPVAQQERKKYMADITLFYRTVFEKKLQHFIGEQLNELAQIGRTELGTNIIRSNINCFRLIDDWFKEKVSEHIGNITEIRNSLDENESLSKELKEKYK